MRGCALLFLSASLFAAEVTEIGERAWHVVLPAQERQVSVPNPEGLDVFITGQRGWVCWDPRSASRCNGPEGGLYVPAEFPSDRFLDASRPVGALVHRTEDGRTRLAVNDRDDDEGFSNNTGQFEFDVFLAPRAETDRANFDWMRQRLIPIHSTQPGGAVTDLRELARIVGDARIVSLGEATHGTREFFQLKHRILEWLATEMGYRVFALESNMPETQAINEYVLNGTGDPARLIKALRVWPWDTEEVLDMVRWMREFNASGRGPVQFAGYDMQHPALPAQIVREFLARTDPLFGNDIVKVHLDAVLRPRLGQPPFGEVVGQLPVAAVAGRRVRLSGWIKTDNITHGYAGLTWEATAGGRASLRTDMADTGPRGTTDWTRYSIEATMPPDLSSLRFGVTHRGDGTAWFDNLEIEIDGVPYVNSRFDFDFENSAFVGFTSSAWGGTVSFDASTAQQGRQSVRSRFAYMTYADLIAATADIVQRLEANRARYLEQGVAPAEADWIIQNARIIFQYSDHLTAPWHLREKYMAENIRWVASQNPEEKMVVWAHNSHVATAWPGMEPMGAYLRQEFGSRMVVFGFAFDRGAFQAMDPFAFRVVVPSQFTVGSAPVGSFDHMLAATGVPMFALDLREAPRVGAGALLRQQMATRHIGALYDRRWPQLYFAPIVAPHSYDAVIFVETTTRARPLP